LIDFSNESMIESAGSPFWIAENTTLTGRGVMSVRM
jgi:hypothetical protein